MVCPTCGETATSGKRFCGNCGSPLALACPACGSPTRAGLRFCEECGQPLATPDRSAGAGKSPGETPAGDQRPATVIGLPVAAARTLPAEGSPASFEERRLITALFCDLVGFTNISERLDPEDLRDIQNDYFEAMRVQVERYGGTVEKYAGDAVLAIFGTPIAHEDDAERAVLCALGMQAAIATVASRARERWQVEPALRVGVNTGEVVSGVRPSGRRRDVAVTGDAVNTAARIQATAEPGEVLVGLETMRLTRRRIAYGERRELRLKGKIGTVPGYPARGLRERFGERWETSGQATPLVGRDRELLELVDAWMRAQAGDGQLVTVIGDAGVGKSRLLTELLERISGSATIRVLRGRCLSYGQGISLWLIADLLRGLFGIGEQDALEEARSRLHAAVPYILSASSPDTQAEALDVLGEVLGMPPGESIVSRAGAEIRRQALIRNLRLLLGALTQHASTIVVLEDVHWIDAASAQILAEVLSDVPGMRLLVLAAQRPGWTGPWTDWGWTERLTLRPLQNVEATHLAGAVLGGARPSAELERYVAERAGGNPFFVEEMLRALQETGGLEERAGRTFLVPGVADRLPSTLTEVLLARLDRLESPVRSVAQVASVLGRSFSVRLLAEVTGQESGLLDRPLTALQRAEIAFPRRGSDLEYVFKHVSMREVAYNTLVSKRRQELHLATARAIAHLYPTDEYVEIIAYHFARTEEHAEAAAWLERAGDHAAGVYANETAISQFTDARRRLEILAAEPGQLARLDEKLGGALASEGRFDEALVLLESSYEVYRQAHELEAAGRVMAQIGLAHRHRGTAAEGIVRLLPMLEMLTWGGPSPGLASLHLSLAQLFFVTGRYRESLGAAEQASALARAIGDERLRADAEQRRGTALIFLGRSDEGRQALADAIPLAEKTGDVRTLQLALGNLGEAHRLLGNFGEAKRYVERTIEVAHRAGSSVHLSAFALCNLAEVLIYSGELEAAEGILEQATELLSPLGSTWYAAYPPLHRGTLRLVQGRWPEASQLLHDAASQAGPGGDRQALEAVEIFLAELDLLEGHPRKALDRVQPLTLDEDCSLSLLLTVLAQAELALGDVGRAEETAGEAVRVARSKGERLWLVDALRAQGMVWRRMERFAEARAVLHEALELARPMPFPYAEARILLEMSGIPTEHPAGQDPEALRQQAFGIFRRLGAEAYLQNLQRAPAGLD